jgi:hypothetical protein
MLTDGRRSEATVPLDKFVAFNDVRLAPEPEKPVVLVINPPAFIVPVALMLEKS